MPYYVLSFFIKDLQQQFVTYHFRYLWSFNGLQSRKSINNIHMAFANNFMLQSVLKNFFEFICCLSTVLKTWN